MLNSDPLNYNRFELASSQGFLLLQAMHSYGYMLLTVSVHATQ